MTVFAIGIVQDGVVKEFYAPSKSNFGSPFVAFNDDAKSAQNLADAVSVALKKPYVVVFYNRDESIWQPKTGVKKKHYTQMSVAEILAEARKVSARRGRRKT